MGVVMIYPLIYAVHCRWQAQDGFDKYAGAKAHNPLIPLHPYFK